MLIFVTSDVFPNKYNLTAGIFVHNQCIALSNLGYTIVMINTTFLNYKYWFKNEFSQIKFMKTKNNLYEYTLFARGLMTDKLPSISVYIQKKKIEKIMNTAITKFGKPQIIISHFTFPTGYSTLKAFEKFQIPQITIEHHHRYLSNSLCKLQIKYLKYTVEKSSKFLVVSQGLKDNISKYIGNENLINILPNSISNDFRYLPHVQKKNFIFFSAGNLKKIKNFELLIRSFDNGFSKNDNVQLRIAGDGPLYNKLLKLIKSLDRSNQIFLLGKLDKMDMVNEYRDCNVFILTSKIETFGIVFREAMAIGRPVISTKNGGIEFLWNDSLGILLERTDTQYIGTKMKEFIENYDNYNLRNISNEVISKFSENNIISTLINFFVD